MLHLSAGCRYYLYNGNTDMRKGFDSLCGIISSQMKENALGGAVFIFFNKKHNQVKLLLWEGDGFAMYYKRLEQGTYEIPAAANDNATLSISSEQLQQHLSQLEAQVQQSRQYAQQLLQSVLKEAFEQKGKVYEMAEGDV